MTILERQAVITGIGMSAIGRRTGQAAIDMTTRAAQAAIADAGLTPADIDGVTSLGDTPVPTAAKALGIGPRWTGGGFDTGGLLTPVMAAALAVGRGDARHVLVYRTVQMMGGSILPAPSDGADDEDDEEFTGPKISE